jgi:tetratricopeptide (TPR) repeat protein/tRNA A-37 threonylcarbamoyl transferase component Bud32
MMPMSVCPPREHILDYLEGRLAEVDSQQLEQHVEDCSSCQQTMAQLSGPALLPQRDTMPHAGPTADPDSLPPTLPGCQLNGEVRFGGMGVVYFGTETALRRPVAVKVLRHHLAHRAEMVARFEAEAQVCAQLQHPGIVPVYQVGRLGDGRPFYAMKLVKGDTLADLLKRRVSPSADLLGMLGHFRRVCEAMAYAHAHNVLHRDLKPANVMVGAFGEVLLMDWGLAKLLGDSATQEPTPEPPSRAIEVGGDGTRAPTAGALGTIAYMPPEQATGLLEEVDKRSDVFGLGAILCAILTGRPPYVGPSEDHVLRQAMRGDLRDANERLGECGADEEMVALTRRCLSPSRENRPEDAGAVAKAVMDYLAGVEERLRQAEIQRAQAEVKAGEERKRRLVERQKRWVSLGLAAAVLLLVLGGGLAAWLANEQRTRRSQVEQRALEVLERAPAQLEEGWQAHDLTRLLAVKAEAARAVDIARSGSASPTVQQQAMAFLEQVEQRLPRVKANNVLREALLEVSAPQETSTYVADEKGHMVAQVRPSVDDQYASAFRQWGNLDVDRLEANELVERFRQEPEVVVQDVIAALDAWMLERWRQKRPGRPWQPLFIAANSLDNSKHRQQLRALLIGKSPEGGNSRRRLQELHGQVDPRTQPVLTVVLLAQAYRAVGDVAEAEAVLRAALAARPDQVVLLDALGKLMGSQGPARLGEAIACFRAIRARNPRLGLALGWALLWANQVAEGEAVLRDLVRQQPGNPEIHLSLGIALHNRGQFDEAIALHRQAIALKPDYYLGHTNLGISLKARGQLDEAIAAQHRAIALNPDSSIAYTNLGNALKDNGQMDEAIVCYRKALALGPRSPESHLNLGIALAARGEVDEAAAAYRKAIALKPDFPEAHYNLAVVLQAKGELDEAIACYRQTIALNSNYYRAHNNLGNALKASGKVEEAIACYHKAIALKPDFYHANSNLGVALQDRGELKEAIAAYQKAIALKPDHHLAHHNLGVALGRQGQTDEGLAALRKAIALKPDFNESHYNLGILLQARRQFEEAIAAYQKAIALKPDDPLAHNNLGVVLKEKGNLDDAIAVFRRAIALKPDYHLAHTNLGVALKDKGELDEAIVVLRKAIAVKPDFHLAHFQLGIALQRKRLVKEAIAAYQQAIALKPDYHQAHYNLGGVLASVGQREEALAAFRKVIALKPDYPLAYTGLGNALKARGQFDDAVTAYRKAITLDPNRAEVHFHLGSALREQGRFVESLECYQRGHALGLKRPGWKYPSADWVRDAERLVHLEKDLPEVLEGKTEVSIDRQIDYARLCVLAKRFQAAAQLCAAVFAADPKRAEDLRTTLRYNAASAAVLAGCGQGRDADRLDDRERARWRKQALDWLRADLALWDKRLASNPKARAAVVRAMQQWQRDVSLAGIRDREALSRLPELERKEWQQLWTEARDLHARADPSVKK